VSWCVLESSIVGRVGLVIRMRTETLAATPRVPAVHDPEVFSSEILRMLDTARRELDRHVPSYGRCVVCHLPWPCTRVELAAFALEAV